MIVPPSAETVSETVGLVLSAVISNVLYGLLHCVFVTFSASISIVYSVPTLRSAVSVSFAIAVVVPFR